MNTTSSLLVGQDLALKETPSCVVLARAWGTHGGTATQHVAETLSRACYGEERPVDMDRAEYRVVCAERWTAAVMAAGPLDGWTHTMSVRGARYRRAWAKQVGGGLGAEELRNLERE